jgi:hypothetical protein
MGDAGARKAQKIGEGSSISAEQKHFQCRLPRDAKAASDQATVRSGYAYESSIACGDPPAGTFPAPSFRILLRRDGDSAGQSGEPVWNRGYCQVNFELGGCFVVARLTAGRAAEELEYRTSIRALPGEQAME